jgi:hypothetical protein
LHATWGIERIMIPFERPLADHKDQNDHNVLMFVIEAELRGLDRAEKRLQKAIKVMQDFEISYYREEHES